MLREFTERGTKKICDVINGLGLSRDQIIAIHPGNGSRFHVFYWDDFDSQPKKLKPRKAKQVADVSTTSKIEG